jgi:hypothetical protein
MRRLLITLMIAGLIALAFQLFLFIRDRKKNKTIPSKFSILKLLPILLGIIGVGLYFAPWLTLKLTGGLNFFDLFVHEGIRPGYDFTEKLLVYGILLFLSMGLWVTGTIFQLAFRITVKSIPTLVYESLIGLTTSTLAILTISHAKSIFDNMSSPMFPGINFSGLFEEFVGASAGWGLIILVILGILYTAFIIFQHWKTVRKPKEAALTSFDQLRELKQLLDEGVITEEEFARKKADVL